MVPKAVLQIAIPASTASGSPSDAAGRLRFRDLMVRQQAVLFDGTRQISKTMRRYCGVDATEEVGSSAFAAESQLVSGCR